MTHLIGRGRYKSEAYPAPPSPDVDLSIAPLSAQYWVDSGTSVAPADRNGSIAAPYGSLQTAYDAAVASGFTYLTLMVAKASGDLSVNGSQLSCSIVGFGDPLNAGALPYPVSIGTLTLSNSAFVDVKNANISTAVATGTSNLSLWDSRCETLNSEPTSPVAARSSIISTSFTAQDFSADWFSEYSLMNSGINVPTGTIVKSFASIVTGGVLGDATSYPSLDQLRLIWPKFTFSASRTAVLPVVPIDKYIASFDIYEQDHSVTILDGFTSGTIFTSYVGFAMRVTFIYDLASTTWSLVSVLNMDGGP